MSDYLRIEQKARFTIWAIATGGYILSQGLYIDRRIQADIATWRAWGYDDIPS